jgi:hypothetical protein
VAGAVIGTLVVVPEIGQTGPAPGWFADPWDRSGLRWWAGTEWSGYAAPGPRRRGGPRWLRFPLGIGAALFVAVGVVVIILGIVVHFPRFTVSPVTATVQSPLTVEQCDAGQPLDVTVPWKGSPLPVQYYNDPCSRPYATGDEVQLFAGSDNPADFGPTKAWLLEPDTHDPFAVVGPTEERPSIIIGGALLLGLGLALLVGYAAIDAAAESHAATVRSEGCDRSDARSLLS